jgi:GNAT superfamily N-acetyltransferase
MAELEIHQSAAAFKQLVDSFALKAEAEHCLLIGVATRLATVPAPALLLTVRTGQETIGAAIVRPGQTMITSRLPPEILELVGRTLHDTQSNVTGILGPVDTVDRFSALWSSLAGKTTRLFMANRVFQLDAVVPPPPTSGHFRQAAPADVLAVAELVRGFCREALREPGEGDFAAGTRDAIAAGRYYVWEDEAEVVSMAATAGPTPNGIRIVTVFTPPERRGRGYASACVGALSQKLLDAGRRYCFLFTDLKNPTSNAIYRKLGYEPVCDLTHVHFL